MEYLRSITLITQKALIAGVLFACAALVSVSAPVARAEPQMTPVPGTTSLTQQLTGETAPQATPDPNAAPTVAQTLATPTTDSSQTDTTVAQSTNPSGTTNTGNKNDPLGCSLSNITLCLTGLVNWVAVEIPSFFLYIAAMFFSAAVHISLTGATYAIDFVATAWTIARDFANMLFLFILIYIAFQIMLDLDTGATLQTLASVIAIALIVNFSFFGTRLVIDMGNVLSVQIYNAIPADEGAATGSLLSQIGGKDLSSYVMKAINVQGLLSDQNFNNWYTKSNSSLSAFITITVLYICIGAIVITLAVSFFIAGTMFLGRIVFLWTAIALSPLALVMWTLGQTRNLFRSWWNMLFKNAFAPAVFLFMYLILTIFLKTIGAGNGGVVGTVFKSMTPASANLLSQDFLFQLGSNVASIILTLGIVVIFIQQATKATDGLGVASSKWAGNLGAKLNKNIVDRYTNMATKPFRSVYGAAEKGVTGAGKFAYRETVGRGANLVTTKVGAAIQRGAEGVGKEGGALSRFAGRNIYRAGGAIQGGNILGAADFRKSEVEKNKIDKERFDLAGNRATLEEIISDPQNISAKNKKALAGMSGNNLITLLSPGEVNTIAGLLSKDQVDAIGKSDSLKYTADEKKRIKDAWQKAINDALIQIAKKQPDQVVPADISRLDNTSAETIVNALSKQQLHGIAQFLSDTKIKEFEKLVHASFDDAQKAELRTAWNDSSKEAPHQKIAQALAKARSAAGTLLANVDTANTTGVSNIFRSLGSGTAVNAAALNAAAAQATVALNELRAKQKAVYNDFKAGRANEAQLEAATAHALKMQQDVVMTIKQAQKDIGSVAKGTARGTAHGAGEVIMS